MVFFNDILRIVKQKIFSFDEINENAQYWENYFCEKELAFQCNKDQASNFSKLSFVFHNPCLISNCMIEIDTINKIEIKRIIDNLDFLGCNALVLISKETNIELIGYTILQSKKKHIKSIEVITNYKSGIEEEIEKFYRINNAFYTITICRSFNKIVEFENFTIVYTEEVYSSFTQCGKIEFCFFRVNIPLFTESQLHNTCLNRKICIDADGEIKNCPSMKQSYGNIKDTTLKEAMEKPGFKDLWFICKDKIDVCKDCEFRHMCTDCRAFIKDPENIYSQPAKCPYNPYIAKWQGEEGYVPVEECGTYTKEKGFVVNKRKVNKLNKEIWGEE